jgi:hypothetical protein
MHMMKKCGGLPCDRHLDRRKVAIAAAAAILLFATSARAGVVELILNEDLSSLSYAGSTVDLSFAVAKAPPGTVVVPYTASTDFSGAGANGLVAHYAGHMYADITSSTITTLSTGPGYQLATGSVPVTWDRGAYIPNIDNNGDPSGSHPNPNFGGAPVDLGNYGITVSAVGAFARAWDMNIGPSSNHAPNGAQAMAGPVGAQTFFLAPLIWEIEYGYQALVSGLGSDLSDLGNILGPGVGFPLPLGGHLDTTGVTPTFTPNATTGVWDALTQTLTLNVDGRVTYVLDEDLAVFDSRRVSGTLVYNLAIPEPSSMLLAGCGIAGLLSLAWRSRKRQPLVA